MIAGIELERMAFEASRALLLQPEERLEQHLVISFGRGSPDHGARHNVEIAVAVQVAGLGAHRAHHGPGLVRLEAETPAVFDPLDAVVRLGTAEVEGIAVGRQQIEVPVLVEVDQGQAGVAPAGSGGTVDLPGLELQGAPVEVGGDRLVLL